MCFFRNDNLFSEIYQKYSNYIYRISYMYMRNSYEAEEVVQSSFIKLYSCNKEFETEEHVKAWLIAVASNHCKNELKHWWKTRREDFDITTVIDENNTDESIEILEKLKNLPEKYKLPIILFYYDGYDIKQIAGMLSKNENTVKTLLKRAKEKLKEYL